MLALAMFFILFSFAVSLPTLSCPEGMFVNNGTCTPCPLGTYNSDTNSPSCTPCPAGFKGVQTGGKYFFLACIECPPGTFAAVPGSTSCTPCPSGLGSGYRYGECVSCPPGSVIGIPFRDKLSICTPCDENTFSKGGVVFECKQCPERSFNNKVGSSRCKSCPPGSFSEYVFRFPRDSFRCKSCPPGTFSDVRGLSRCKACPPGTSSEERATSCKPCPRGKFSSAFGTASCLDCPRDTSSLGLRPAGCKHVRRGCPFGTFESIEGECEKCIPGERYDEKTNRCQPCGTNQTSLGGVSSVCSTCTEGAELGVFNICKCKKGFIKTRSGCVACPSNSFNSNCLRCNFFEEKIPNADLTECEPCPVGTYFKRGLCLPCPPGFQGQTTTLRKNIVRRQCVSKSTGCPLGLTRRGTTCSLEKCEANERFFRGSCRSCPPGYYMILANARCSACPPKQTSQGGIVSSCSKCPKGKIGRRGSCVCPRGTEEKTGVCVKCPAGTTSNDGERCYPCEINRFTNSPGELFCKSCPENQVTTVASGATGCVQCPTGSKVEVDYFRSSNNRCIPVDPYNNDRAFVASLPGFPVA